MRHSDRRRRIGERKKADYRIGSPNGVSQAQSDRSWYAHPLGHPHNINNAKNNQWTDAPTTKTKSKASKPRERAPSPHAPAHSTPSTRSKHRRMKLAPQPQTPRSNPASPSSLAIATCQAHRLHQDPPSLYPETRIPRYPWTSHCSTS